MAMKLLRYGASTSARSLADRLGIRILRDNTDWRPRGDDLILNWGKSEMPFGGGAYLNHPLCVANAVDKIASLTLFTEARVPTLDWTTEPSLARVWCGKGETIVCRATVTGRGGRGITIIDANDAIGDVEHSSHLEWPVCPLYTKYFKRRDEYRIHVFNGQVIDAVQKRRRNGVDADNRVRSYGNGWIFARNDVEVPEAVNAAAIQAVLALGLDFGAADVGWNAHHSRAAVFEVNTAPGIEGTTLDRYVEQLARYV